MRKLIVIAMAAFMLVSFVSVSHAKVLVKGTSVVKISEDINMGEDLHFEDLVAIRGNINVKGKVDGDVVAVLGSVHLYPSARVGGDVVSVGGNIIRDTGSNVGGDIVNIMANKEAINMMNSYAPVVAVMGIGGFLVMKLLMFIGFIALAVVLVSIMMKQVGVISSKIEKNWLKSLLWGVVSYILICPVAFLLLITIVGAPLILIELVLISAAMIMGFVAISQLIGKKFTKAIRRPNQPMLTEVICGMVLLFLLELVPVVGPLVKWIAVTMGFGSAVMTKLGTKA